MAVHPKDVQYAELMRRKPTREARAWIDDQTIERTIGSLCVEQSTSFVHRLYACGAVAVHAVDIRSFPPRPRIGLTHPSECVHTIIVEIPMEPAAVREKLFSFESEHAIVQGFDGVRDEGQRLLFFKAE